MSFSVLLALALALNPSAQEAQVSAALSHAEAARAADEGRDAEALTAFQRLANVNPEDHKARLWIAQLHARMGNQNLAEPVYRSVLLEDPSNVDAMVGIARALLAREEPTEALKLLEPAAALAPDNAEITALIDGVRAGPSRFRLRRSVGAMPRLTRRR